MKDKQYGERTKNEIVAWIQDWFSRNGEGCNAVVGISGGKDSSVVAALCVEALGADRVIGVMMPNVAQADIEDSKKVCRHLKIRSFMLPITAAVADTVAQLRLARIDPTTQALINLPARIRMTTLYAVAQSLNGRVANTCNLSEDYVGYSTRWGDSVGDFSPLANLTVSQVKEVGYALKLPKKLVDKVPADGLCDKTDEDNLGFTYAALDVYIQTGKCDDEQARQRIDRLHEANRFKLQMPEAYVPRSAQ